jgi:glycosyltransferase involved in cell wall biosynthesis
MRLLILTQKVDMHDGTLGFMHRWLEVFSGSLERLTVICLERGTYDLPQNVRVLSLGKEERVSTLRYIVRFYRFLSRERKHYDGVFVHMNEEYVLLGGLIWRFMGKRLILWRNHGKGSWRTRLAGKIAQRVCYTSPQSFTATFKNSVQMPVGIDTEHFAPEEGAPRDGVLILGRIDPVKNVREMVVAASDAGRAHPFTLTVVGSPGKGSEAYAQEVKELLKAFPGTVREFDAVPNTQTRNYFKRADIVLNFTIPGSFDKAMFEASACGALLLTTNDGVRGQVPDACVTTLSGAGEALKTLLALPPEGKDALRRTLRTWVIEQHSLSGLVKKLHQMFEELSA